MVAVLAPDGAAVVFAFMRRFKGIVDGGNDKDEPGDGGEDFVGEDGVLGVGRGLAEGIRYCWMSASPWSRVGGRCLPSGMLTAWLMDGLLCGW